MNYRDSNCMLNLFTGKCLIPSHKLKHGIRYIGQALIIKFGVYRQRNHCF